MIATEYTGGSHRGVVFHSGDGGAHWEPVGESLDVRPQGLHVQQDCALLLAATQEQHRLRAYSAVLEDKGKRREFLIGGRPSVVLGLSDAGADSRAIMSVTSSLYAISGGRSGVVAACGPGGAIFRADSRDREWKRVKAGTRADLNSIAFLVRSGRTEALAVGEGGIILASLDDGVTWKRLAHGMGRRGFWSVEFLDGSKAVMAADDGLYLVELSEAFIADRGGACGDLAC